MKTHCKILLMIILGCVPCLMAQSKYYGGSLDGYADSSSVISSLNGIGSFASNKYSGGSRDGFADSSSVLSNLGGTGQQLSAKYYGGSYDGLADSSSLLSNLGGSGLQLFAKYYGGSRDGFADSSTLLVSLNGNGSQVLAKYFGGSFDGFADSSALLVSLNGNSSPMFAKYYGGSFDGLADNVSVLTKLNGGGSVILAKFSGGGFDGFADQSSLLTPLSGLVLSLRITALIEGFYNSGTNSMIGDTVSVYLRSSIGAPFTVIDSAKAYLNSSGIADLNFFHASSAFYYIVVKHRNSIETWSKSGGQNLAAGSLNLFDFTAAGTQAYGSNLTQKGSRWCIYSGDVNQDGVIDGTDLSLIDNGASNFATGYAVTDVNGDQVIDGSDLAIADNNASSFVASQKPPGAGEKPQARGIKRVYKSIMK